MCAISVLTFPAKTQQQLKFSCNVLAIRESFEDCEICLSDRCICVMRDLAESGAV